ncbi:carbamoyl phosphate synthase small subunit [Escherichia coli]|uniref:Carbamoyl phosphate synthase small subunit n=1 Tax=Escherichia coli TaxID=562 RepID=A0A377DXL1_ECOLX|nr:carbamoyl phosphate synthase small subunit [Escherichia coli]
MIRDLPLIASNFRNTEDLSSYLKRHNIVAIADIDTRKLTRLLREKGAQNGCIIAGDNPDAALALEKARAFPGLNGMDLAKEVTTAEAYSWTQGSWTLTVACQKRKKKTSCRSTSWLMILVPSATSCGCWWIEAVA